MTVHLPGHPARRSNAHPARPPDRPDRRPGRSRRQPDPAPNPSGVHFLQARVAAELVRCAGVGAGDLVMDFGAGAGAVTAPLAATGARVLAVERDAAFARRLERRFARTGGVRVVRSDLRSVPLPRRGFAVVASVPFAVTTPLLRRLLDERADTLTGADLVVEWGLAKRLTDPHPRTLEVAWWQARFELRVSRRIPASSFTPPPRVDAAHLMIRPRPGLRPGTLRVLHALLRTAYATPGQPARAVVARPGVSGRQAHRLLTASGIDPPAPAESVTPDQWAALAEALTA